MHGKPYVLSVNALIQDGRGRYLAIRRSAASKNNAGRWDFPGGRIDVGEAFDAALIREVAEETGLTVLLERVPGAGESELPDRKRAVNDPNDRTRLRGFRELRFAGPRAR